MTCGSSWGRARPSACCNAAGDDAAAAAAAAVAGVQLPITEVLADVVSALESHSNLVLEAPPGAGKTTIVPLALLAHAKWLGGTSRIVMIEPRRLAARAAARRMAAALSQRVGDLVGYTVRGESVVSAATRIEVVTSGVLVRRLQRDPGLSRICAILLDEFHERGLDSDLVLALAANAQAELRPDLRLVVMSATLGDGLAQRTAEMLCNAPVVRSQGRSFPVDIIHLGEPPPGELERATAVAVRRALQEQPLGDMLVFLPGAPEIRRTQALLEDSLGSRVEVLPLYGELPQEQQDAALAPRVGEQLRRVVLSTSIAESSLTIPGVRLVIDCGLSRRSVFNPGTGLSRLVTVKTSTSSADQRAGRAGRTQPGACYRLYGANTNRDAHTPPEVESADLASVALELALWGGHDLPWLDPPPSGALTVARSLLKDLGAVDATTGSPTTHGTRMAALGVHPRLAHMLLRAHSAGPSASRLACDLAALLEERSLLRKGGDAIVGGPGADIRLRVAALRGQLRDGDAQLGGWDVDRGVASRVRSASTQMMDQLEAFCMQQGEDTGAVSPSMDADSDPFAAGLLLSLAYPDRIGKGRSGRDGGFTLAGGKQAAFWRAQEEPLMAFGSTWLVAADVDGDPTRPRILAAAPLPPLAAEHPWIAPLANTEDRVFWNPSAGVAAARRVRTLGAIVLAEDTLPAPQGEALTAALLCGIRDHLGLTALKWSRDTRAWRARVQFLATYAGDAAVAAGCAPLPDLSDGALLTSLEIWLAPFLSGVTTKAQLASTDVSNALRLMLTPKQLRFVEEAAPTHFTAPSGSRIPINYDSCITNGGVPEVAVRLQEMFGFTSTPCVGGVPLCMSLLSPASREVARTSDLASFWTSPSGYAAVRKDLRGRYPKHNWPDDPFAAKPSAKVKSKV